MTKLAKETEEHQWSPKVSEVRGSWSICSLLKELGIKRRSLKQVINKLANSASDYRKFLWKKKQDSVRGSISNLQ